MIYDPATTTSAGGAATRTAFPGNTIPDARIDPVARRLLERYPLPTGPGTANNYRRVADERVDQDQGSVRVDHHLRDGADRLFARVTRFGETFVPVTPLPDGSGVTSGTLGPQRTRASATATSYLHVFSERWLHELRVGDTRRSVDRAAATVDGSTGTSLGLPGIPSTARFADTLPTFLVAGYQQLGSPPNTATEFGTSVTQIADAFTWQRGRHTIKFGADLRWSRLDVVQPPSPTGQFTFSNLFTNQPTPTASASTTGTPFASFLLGQVQLFSIDRQQQPIRNRAHIQEYFVQDDWRVASRWTVNAGLRYTLNFPSTEVDDQSAVFNLDTAQLEYAGKDGQPRAARELHTLNLGPRMGIVGRVTDRTVVRLGYGLVWIEMAGITTPFTTPVFPFLQTVSQRTLDNVVPAFVLADGPNVQPIPPTPDAGLGQGVFSVDRDLGSGYVQQWNASMQRELRPNLSIEVAYVGSKITRVGLPDTNLNQLTVEQLALGAPLQQRVLNPFFGQIPRSSSLGDPTIPAGQLLKPYPQYTTVSLYRNNTGTTHLPRRLHQAGTAADARPVVPRVLHALEAGGRRLVGLRRVHPHRAGRQLPGRRQLQPEAGAGLLDRRPAARLRHVGDLGPAVRRQPGARPVRMARRDRQRLDADRHPDAAVRVRRWRSPRPRTTTRSPASARSGRTCRAIRSCRATSGRWRAGSTRRPSPPRRRSPWAAARATRCAGRAIAAWTSR